MLRKRTRIEEADVFSLAMSPMRPARRFRVPLRRPGSPATARRRQPCRGAAGALVPPLRLPPLADGPARRPYQRSPRYRLAGRGSAMTATPAGPLPPGCWTDPARPISFTFDGRTIEAVHGQTIAAALYAAGVRIFSRS